MIRTAYQRNDFSLYAQRESAVALNYEATILLDNPIFVAPMTEAAGNITDIIGGKVGTVNGVPTYSVAGPIFGKTAIQFTADTQFFAFLDHVDLDLGNVFSIEIWLRRDVDTGGNEIALAKLGGGAYGVGGNPADQYQLARVGVGTVAAVTAVNPVSASFVHWVYTHSATGAGNTIAYRNGVAVAVTNGGEINNALVNTAGDLILGRESLGNSWRGAMAYAALYPTILSAGRVSTHYAARNTP